MGAMNMFAASVQAKKGRLYAVIQTKENGKSKPVWRALGLAEGTSQSKINKAYREVVTRFEEEYEKNLRRGNKPDADIPIFEYMCGYLKKCEKSIQINTYKSYYNMVYGKIKKYFDEEKPYLTVGNLKPKDIKDFYDFLYGFGVNANTVIHYRAVMHKAFKQAFMDEMIYANPFDRVERPKAEKFHGENYSEEELITLLELTKSETIYPAIMIAACLGTRRSEALGMRWSRINWEQHTVLLDTKMVEVNENGTKTVKPVEEMKNKSSRRTLPIPDQLYEYLLELKEKQSMYREMFKSSYNRKNDDYVCVNELGELIKPSYVTSRFADILKSLGMRKIRFHDLRHTVASILLAQDVPLINVSDFLGHSDIQTTANIYAHLDKKSKQESADIITNVLNKAKA